jgi:copper chaperone
MRKPTELQVDGMSCQSCVRHVREALEPLAGVTHVRVELEPGRVQVEHDPEQVSVTALIEAIRDAGYEARATS